MEVNKISDIQLILKLNQEISDFVKKQEEVLTSWEKYLIEIDREEDIETKYITLAHDNKKCIKTLYDNLSTLSENKNKILGLEK